MNYDINIRFINKKNNEIMDEIWADIINLTDGKVLKKLIWWKDKSGIIHDESCSLPIELRSIVDKAWITASKKL